MIRFHDGARRQPGTCNDNSKSENVQRQLLQDWPQAKSCKVNTPEDSVQADDQDTDRDMDKGEAHPILRNAP